MKLYIEAILMGTIDEIVTRVDRDLTHCHGSRHHTIKESNTDTTQLPGGL